jgi:SAM-dependent methyltransferase
VTARLTERLVEARYGVSTGALVYLEDLGLESEERVWHDPSSWIALGLVLSRLGVKGQDVFADVGSGLGRGLLVAARFPFRRLIGVEVSAQLNERARENLGHSRAPRRCPEVHLVTADALEWEIPPDLTVAYLYCPFTGDVFTRFVEKLLDSVDRNPRPLRLVYNYPVEHNLLLRTGRFRPIEVAASRWPAPAGPAERIVTYLVLPSDPALAREYESRFRPRLQGEKKWLGEYDPGFVLEKPARLGGVVLERPRRQP